MSLKVSLGSTQIPMTHVRVTTLIQAVNAVRAFIDVNGLTAGCHFASHAFTGGELTESDEKIGHVSYNGRIWDLDNMEVRLA